VRIGSSDLGKGAAQRCSFFFAEVRKTPEKIKAEKAYTIFPKRLI
jgi:hypothetical protein